MSSYVASAAVATGWTPAVVWETPLDMIELVASVHLERASRETGKPYQRNLTEEEAEDLEENRAFLRSVGIVK